MKNTLKTIGGMVAVIATMVMVTSCTKDKFAEDNLRLIPGEERTISAEASFPQALTDKAFLDPSDNYNVKWESGDGLNINGTTLTTTDNNSTRATFEGTLHANTVSGTDHYWAVYPASLAGTYTTGIPTDFASINSLTVHLPNTQTINPAHHALKGNTFMAAHTSVPEATTQVVFELRNLGSVMQLTLQPKAGNADNRVDSLVFTSSNASLAGTFEVSDDPDNPTVTPTAGTNKFVVKFQNGSSRHIDITSGVTLYVFIPPLASKNLNIKIYGAYGHYTEKNMTSANLARSRYYTSTINEISFEKTDVLGPFSVAADRKVYFSPGNLQYNAVSTVGSTNPTHWRFAENQWNYVGDGVAGNVSEGGVQCNNSLISSSYLGWIDNFGWGTSGWNSGATAYQPYSTSIDNTYYYPGGVYSNNLTDACAQADWGVYNAIYNPKTNQTDPANTWRTLTNDEWAYLLDTRTTSSGIRYAKATVNNVPGLILVPDNWSTSTYALANTNTPGAVYTDNVINLATWTTLETVGAVFLPAAGYRDGTTVNEAASFGVYWSSTYYNSNQGHGLLFNNVYVSPNDFGDRSTGPTVRLVRDVSSTASSGFNNQPFGVNP